MEKENTSTKKKTLLTVAARIAFLTALLFLIAYVIFVFSDSFKLSSGFTERIAYINFDEDIEAAEALVGKHFENLEEVVDKLQYADSKASVDEVIGSYIGSPQFGNLRYYSNGASYTASGLEITQNTAGKLLLDALADSKLPSCTDIYYDGMLEFDCIAFYMPVKGSAYVDGIFSILAARNVIDVKGLLGESKSAVILADKEGRVYSASYADSFAYSAGNNVFSFLDVNSGAESANKAEDAVLSGKKSVLTISLSGTNHTVCISPVSSFGGNLSLITITSDTGFVTPELEYIRHMINISVMAVAVLLVGIAYALYYYGRVNKEITEVQTTDSRLGCPNAEAFRTAATKLIEKKDCRYAVAVLEIRQFIYLSEKLSGNDMTELLKFIAKVMETFCEPKETYGYLGDGKFALLTLYENDSSIKSRVRLIETLVNKNSVMGTSKSKRKFNIGITLAVQNKKQTVPELLAYASIACEKAKNDINVPYVIFNEQIKSEHSHHDAIEAEMESALVNNEFRLFLQPKYNVDGDRIDSAEALVRWFDPKRGDYRFPGEFIGLFESNGFITKLDHYMYIETLKYLSSAAERGEKIVPISVNVSMVTVSSPDFLDFYIDNKKKYRVGDNFIMIEFTESFAMEDYNKIRDIVDALHKNGIKASLDDFGSGYSSLGALKNIPFDELKFDRLFLSDGCNMENDDKMLKAMFDLSHSLGIRVVMEGVETKEMFDGVVAKGCDVIQGYYYAKAISAEEYRLFINSNTSIKYKSKVK